MEPVQNWFMIEISNIGENQHGYGRWSGTGAVCLTFLTPSVVDAMLDGRLRATIDGTMLLATGTIDPEWHRQEARSLPG